MGKSIPITIGDEAFLSKGATKTRVRTIIGQYSFGEYLNAGDMTFFLNLFQHHTEYTSKIGGGIRAIEVRGDEQGNRYLHLHRTDGTDVDISWSHCIYPKKCEAVVLEALRSSVKEQIQEAKERFLRSGTKCPFRGTQLSASNSHVDHFQPTFSQLVSEFLRHHSLQLCNIKLVEQPGNDFRGLIADEALRNAWESFHRANAKLRLISSAANLSDARRKS